MKKGFDMLKSAKITSIALSVLLGLSLLAACKTIPTTGTMDDVCLIWRPITYSASGETPRTVNEIRAQNARRDAYCGKEAAKRILDDGCVCFDRSMGTAKSRSADSARGKARH